ITEGILAAVWNEQAPLRGPIWDCLGEPVAVVYRGRWSGGSGPDFQGAMLSLGGDSAPLVTGSVEMHLMCADWWAHGHHNDPRYNSVALHVVLWPNAARPVTRQDGVQVPTVVLGDYVTVPSTELLSRVSPLVANLGTMSEEPCWQRTQEWPIERLQTIVEEAGDERLLRKAAAFEADLDVYRSPDDLFYKGMMDALGYSANREPMRALAEVLPLDALLTLPLTKNLQERVTLLEAVLLGAAGLLPSQHPTAGALDWLSEEYAEEVERLWQAHASMVDMSGAERIPAWNSERVRPANSPYRRLAAAARLLAQLLWERGGMLGPFIDIKHLQTKELVKRWTALLTVSGEGYWASHSGFGQALGAGKDSIALVGSSRSADMVVNILLPLLVGVAERERDRKLGETALRVYAEYPRLAENNITKAMLDEALGPRGKSLKAGARGQQGLIHLYRLFCEARRCHECPLSGSRGS
ncbi:MAG: DUF2851 family protein, partial [Chloroflexota bacterium]|nr:DUF2851 family protein [Chloroflexota bacterium]